MADLESTNVEAAEYLARMFGMPGDEGETRRRPVLWNGDPQDAPEMDEADFIELYGADELREGER